MFFVKDMVSNEQLYNIHYFTRNIDILDDIN